MTDKEKSIIELLKLSGNKSYYIDIRDKVGQAFDNESDFDNCIALLQQKNWIYENEKGDTLYLLNTDMLNTISYQTRLDRFNIKTTGADGGHNYISTEIEYEGNKRNMVVMFLKKSDEKRLADLTEIEISGDLMDDGVKYDLTLLNTEIIN